MLFCLARPAGSETTAALDANGARIGGDGTTLAVHVDPRGRLFANWSRQDRVWGAIHDASPAVIAGGRNILAEVRPTLELRDIDDALGKGKSIEATYQTPGGTFRAAYCLYDKAYFFTAELFITPSGPMAVKEARPLEGVLHVGRDAKTRILANTKMWNTTVTELEEETRSIFCAALHNNHTAVLGAMSAQAASWVSCKPLPAGANAEADNSAGRAAFCMSADYGQAETHLPGAGELRLSEGQTASTGRYFAGMSLDALDSLDEYARAVKTLNRLRPYRPIPCGWCSWDGFGWTMNQRQIYDTLAAVKKLRLPEYGFNVLQLDDGWQRGWRCSGDWQPNLRFPGGLAPLARACKDANITLGLWLAPFYDEDGEHSAGPDGSLKPSAPAMLKDALPVLLNNPQFMTTAAGVVTGKYDLTRAEYGEFLTRTFRRAAVEWGAKYIKADFLYGGDAQAELSLPAHDIYRNALKRIRAGLPQDAYLMTCTGFEWKALGLADGQRVGDDIRPTWHGLYPTARCAAGRFYTNGNFWWNDPDQLHVEGGTDANGQPTGLSLDQARAWAALVALYGGVTITGDRLDLLTPERFKLLTQCMPPSGTTARPLDLFDVLTNRRPNVFASVWALRVAKPFGDYHVAALFNWTKEAAAPRTLDLNRLQYAPPAEEPPSGQVTKILVYDYWQEKLLPLPEPLDTAFLMNRNARTTPPERWVVTVAVPPTSCRLLVIHRVANQPRFISSNRHLTAGCLDVQSADWHAPSQTLSGKSSALVSNVSFQYVFYVPDDLRIACAEFDGVSARVREEASPQGKLGFVSFTPSRPEIRWAIRFEKAR